MKKCPYCAEEIQDEAIKCKHCGEKINKYMYKDNRNDKKEVSVIKIKNNSLKNIGIILLVIFSLFVWYLVLPILLLYWLDKNYNVLDDYFKFIKDIFKNSKNKNHLIIGFVLLLCTLLLSRFFANAFVFCFWLVISIFLFSIIFFFYDNQKIKKILRYFIVFCFSCGLVVFTYYISLVLFTRIPEIVFLDNGNMDVVYTDSIEIKGKVIPSKSKVFLRKKEIKVNEDGIFSEKVGMIFGKNSYEFEAVNGMKKKKVFFIITRELTDEEKRGIEELEREEEEIKKAKVNKKEQEKEIIIYFDRRVEEESKKLSVNFSLLEMDQMEQRIIKEVTKLFNITEGEFDKIYIDYLIFVSQKNNSTIQNTSKKNCQEYDGGVVIGCNYNETCILEKEMLSSEGIHYFEGRCVEKF